jgi:hypothetical protein
MASQAPQDEDVVADSEPPCYLVRPSDNVYSFFMFIGPTESKKKRTDNCTWDIVMAYILVVLNFFMQSILVWLVFESVVLANLDWQNGILKLEGGAMGDLFAEAPSECNTGGALCFVDPSGTYTCSPPSIQLTGRWNELDTNKDGVWTWEEVKASREELMCKYVVDPQEVFLVLVEMLKLRENILWLHPDVEAAKAIHHTYFQYILGDLVMCGYRSEDMCSNLVNRGFFDKPLKHETAPRVGTTIESALRYCRQLLQPGGTCETFLPSTYATWKVQSQSECSAPSYEKFTYTNPGSGVTKSLLEVDYSARQEYELAQLTHFRIFKAIILFIWLLLMFCEGKEIWKIITVVMRYPSATDFGEDAVLMEQDPSDPEDVRYRIQGITSTHRRIMGILCILRTGVTVALMFVGMSYIIKTNGYVDLLMNGVTLLFVADVSNILYSQVLRDEIRDQCEDIKAMKVPMYGWEWLNRRPALLDIVSVAILMLVVYMVMWWNLENVTLPIYNALECTCLSAGEKCFEAQQFNKPWWDDYWMNVVPGVFKEVDALKTTVPGAAFYVTSKSDVMDQSQATAYHQQLESRVENIAMENLEMQKMIDQLNAAMASMPEHPGTANFVNQGEIKPEIESTSAAPPAQNATKSQTNSAVRLQVAAQSVNGTTPGELNTTTPHKLNSTLLIEKKRALSHIKGSQHSKHHNLQ